MTDYASSGVNLQAGAKAVDLMAEAVRSTYGPEVLAGLGSFGGVYDASALKNARAPLLVASTDGVGTKVMLAARFDRYESLGQDLVNHCVNDILVQGARPLFFLDYLASSRLEPEKLARVVSGMAQACREAGCALLGGETAEMPGVYCDGQLDVVGTVVGVVERDQRLPRGLAPGDVLLGLASSGPHTNGFSLIRKVYPDPDPELVDALLQPHRSYQRTLGARLKHVKALAHITGGGLYENLPRVLPVGLRARVIKSRWEIPPLFARIARDGSIDETEMFRVFNMGIGMVAVLPEEHVDGFREGLGVESYVLGQLESGERGVELV